MGLLVTKLRTVYCWVWEGKKFKLVNIWQSYKQKRDCLARFLRLLAMCWPGAKVHETITLLLVTLPSIHRFNKIFTHTLSNKPVLIWLLIATLPCNLSLMACFADIDVSRGSVATYARCGGMFNIHLTANLLRNLPVKKKFVNRLRFDRIMVMSLWPRFLAHPVYAGTLCANMTVLHSTRPLRPSRPKPRRPKSSFVMWVHWPATGIPSSYAAFIAKSKTAGRPRWAALPYAQIWRHP